MTEPATPAPSTPYVPEPMGSESGARPGTTTTESAPRSLPGSDSGLDTALAVALPEGLGAQRSRAVVEGRARLAPGQVVVLPSGARYKVRSDGGWERIEDRARLATLLVCGCGMRAVVTLRGVPLCEGHR